MILEKRQNIIININDLRNTLPNRLKELLNNFCEEQTILMSALHKFVSQLDPGYAQEHANFYVGFKGSFGSHHVTPRTMSSKFAGKLVYLEGIVSKCSLVSTNIVKSVHYCPVTKKTIEHRHTNTLTSPSFVSSSVNYPTRDDDGNPLEIEYGLSVYKNKQELTIQEMPEEAAVGQSFKVSDCYLSV